MLEILKTSKHNRWRSVCGVLIATLLIAPAVHAQLRDYRQLAFRHSHPGIYLSTFSLPGSQKQAVQLTVAFRISHKMLSFKKVNEPGSSRYYAVPSLGIVLYKSRTANSENQVSIVDMKSVARDTWRDTVYAESYEATTDASEFATGFMQFQLPPGNYVYIIQFNENKDSERTSAKQFISLGRKKGEIILAEAANKGEGQIKRLSLINMGSNVLYRKDFSAFIHLPDYSSTKNYRLTVHRINISDEDTVEVGTAFETTIDNSSIFESIHPTVTNENGQLVLHLQQADNGFTYALVQIPNHKLPDESYKIEVIEDETDDVVAQKAIHSLWLDKPISLYDTDLAITMLRYIVDEQTIDRINSGSLQDKREKLNAFWDKRDPTPNTEYNELKVEYYSRIDYAYRHYSAQRTPGFETDRGRIYILYGAPDNIERVFPDDGATREIWTYPKRRFVFKATSGFGDFVLVK